jgi:hypothetical protein
VAEQPWLDLCIMQLDPLTLSGEPIPSVRKLPLGDSSRDSMREGELRAIIAAALTTGVSAVVAPITIAALMRQIVAALERIHLPLATWRQSGARDTHGGPP